MPKVEFPSQPTDELKLADWLEIRAFLAADRNSSMGDLESGLNLSSVLERGGSDAVERKCLDAFNELEDRAFCAGDGYPFEVDGSVLRAKANIEEHSAYIFCLCLSYFQWSTLRKWEINIDPWLLFEELSAIAAAQFIDGKVMNFGTSRKATKTATRAFRATVDVLCKNIGEGEGFKDQDILDTKDDKVDLVAWRDFADGKSSKLIMFGQCAGGDGWLGKLSELQPQEFWDQWMVRGKVSQLIKSFYIPHRIPSPKWDKHARKTGLMFDRCRIAYWAFQDNTTLQTDKRYRRWCKHILKFPTPRPKP